MVQNEEKVQNLTETFFRVYSKAMEIYKQEAPSGQNLTSLALANLVLTIDKQLLRTIFRVLKLMRVHIDL